MSKLESHKEHGLNPTLPVCIICGQDKGDIVLLGNAYKEKAPMRMLVDAVPCEECQEKYLKTGVLLVESTEDGGITGKVTVITDEGFQEIFDAPPPNGKVVFINIAAMEQIQALFERLKAEAESDN